MKDIIKDYCTTCYSCQLNNRSTSRKDSLGKLPIGNQVLDLLFIDLIEAPITSLNGYKHILSVVDSYSKYGWTFAIKDKSSEEIINALQNIIYTYGPPYQLYSDNGTNFTSEYNEAIYKRLGIKLLNYHANNHKGNGIVERFNSTIQMSLRKYFDIDATLKQNWDTLLNKITFHYNCSLHNALEMGNEALSPFHLMFERTPELESFKASNSNIHHLQHKEYYDSLQQSIKDLDTFVKFKNDNTINYAQTNGRKIDNFKIGDKILIKNIKRQHKWSNNYIGPYIITSFDNRNGVVANLCEDESKVINVHVDVIKHYKSSSTFVYENETINNSNNNSENKHFEVEAIEKHKFKNNQYLFYIKWKNYDRRYNQWISKSAFSNSSTIIDKYIEQHHLKLD